MAAKGSRLRRRAATGTQLEGSGSPAIERDAGPPPAVLLAALGAMDQLEALFFVKDTARRFLYCTEALAQHLGYLRAAQVLGLRDEELSPAHLADHYRRYDESVLGRGERIVDLVELVRNADGRYAWYTTTKWPLLDHGRTIIGLAGVIKSLNPRPPHNDELAPLTPALQLIADQYQRRITIAELAEAAAMSQSQFTRQFKRRLGTTPHRYLRSVRLRAACDLLCSTGLPLSSIAQQTGYYDHSHLTNDFRREFRLSPKEYRRAQTISFTSPS
jgi:PAS domain S-box-containing protein